MASDLQINIELAKALGWRFTSASKILPNEVGIKFTHVFCNKNGYLRIFDYREPVVFVAICKHWGITTQFRQNAAVLCHDDFSVDYVPSDSIEKAAALLVIDLVKRGVK